MHVDDPFDGDDEVDPCYLCDERNIICWCIRAESCNDCGEYWCWCSCEREGIDVIGTDTFKNVYRCKLVTPCTT